MRSRVEWMICLAVTSLGLATTPLAVRDRTRELPRRPPEIAGAAAPATSMGPTTDLPSGLFRLGRAVPDLAPGPQHPETDTPPLSLDPPPYRVSGIVVGVSVGAIIERLGEGGAVFLVTVGDSIEGFTIAAIRGDTVRLTRGDSEWRLALDRPWSG